MTSKLGKFERLPLSHAWKHEAYDFTPWLASDEGMELLQETLEMELEVEATEKYVGPFKADILAKRTDTTDDHWVLIENQLEKTDHKHLGQLLTYAAGLDAVTIVWIAQSFEEQHQKALEWLNEITGDELEFFGLEIELWQIAGSLPAPKFNKIAEPNDWSREVKQAADAQVSDLKLQQKQFWEELRKKLLEKKSKVKPQKAHPQHWADYAIGRSDTWLCATVNSNKKHISVEFNMRGPPGKAWFNELEAHRDEIDAKIPGLFWQRLDGKKSSKVAIFREGSDSKDEDKWPVLHAWLIENLELFREVFRPYALSFSDGSGMTSDTVDSDEADID